MESPAPKRKRFYRRKRFIIPLLFVAAFLGLVGPWPIYSSSYEGQDFSRQTFERIDSLSVETVSGPLQAGFAQADITPPVGEPLAGYGGRKPMASEGANGKLYAKALSLSAGDLTVTIVSADILLVMPELRREVLRRTSLPPRLVYFAATHTHSGPGGYSSRWVDQLVLGKYSQAAFDRLAKGLSDAILQSRSSLGRASVSTYALPTDVAVNRIDPKLPALRTVYQIAVYGKPGWIAQLFVCPAHATCYGSENHLADGDYPGVLEQKMQETMACPVMVLAGAVGSMGPPTDQPRGQARAQDAAGRVMQSFLTSYSPPAVSEAKLSADILPVDLPPLQYRVSQSWRLSPAATRYLHDGQSYIQVLRVNDIVLLGMPADYSGELAMRLAEQADQAKLGLIPVVTSFNGDYVGYLLPQERYWKSNMESVDENLCGPFGGEYFNDLALRLLRKLNE